jgi:hypothetical protein
MASGDWDIVMWQQASDLLQQVERIHRNFLQVAPGVQYRSFPGRSPAWEPPANVGRCPRTSASSWIAPRPRRTNFWFMVFAWRDASLQREPRFVS